MATPIGHALAGYMVYEAFTPDRETNQFKVMFFCMLMAMAADLDFVPGIVLGRPNLYHQGISHSVIFGVIASIIVAGVIPLQGNRFSTVFKLGALSYLSHLLIDVFAPDGRPPYGLPLFWPITSQYFISHVSLFLGVRHSGLTEASTSQWLMGVFSIYNIRAVAIEFVLIGPFALLAKSYRQTQSKH
jgi:inner membrane protein